MIDIIEVVIAIIVIVIMGAAIAYVESYLTIVFPGLFVTFINLIIAALIIKFIIGRNHG